MTQYETMCDEDLMLGVQRHDRRALEALVRRYHQRIYQFVYRKLSGHHSSEDVTQECFVRVCARSDQYQYPRPFRPWVYTIAHNLCRSLYRSARYQLETPLDQAAEGRLSTGESQVAEELERKEVWAALESLSGDHREVVILRFYEDMKVADIAEVLSLPVGTVKSRLFYAVQTLRRTLVTAGGEGV